MREDNWKDTFPKVPEVFHHRLENTLQSLEEAERKKSHGRIKWKKSLVLAAALGLVIGLSLTVYAAVHLFTVHGEKNEETGTYTYYFETEKELEAAPIKIIPGYLPEGFAAEGDDYCKYSKGGNNGEGITIISNNWSSKLSVPYVSAQEETELNGVRAEILTRNGLEYNHIILLFYEEEGQVIEIMASDGISLDEVKKVADNITYEVLTGEEADTYQAFSQSKEREPDMEFDNTIKKSNMIQVGEEVQDLGVSKYELDTTAQPFYCVDNIEVSDTIQELHKEGFGVYYDLVRERCNSDGSLKPRERVERYWEDDEMKTKSETVGMKFLYVTLTLQNKTGEAMTDISVYPCIRFLQEEEDGTYSFIDRDYEWDELVRENSPIYFDQSDYSEPQHFFFMDLKAGETREVHLLYAVDEDRIDTGYLTFNLGGYYSREGCTDQYLKITD